MTAHHEASNVVPGESIVVKGLTVEYGKISALNNLDLAFPRGCVGLLGPNGAGKSSTLKAILGFVRPVAGRIHIFGIDAVRKRRTVRRRIGYMPERDTHLAGLTGFRAVSLAGELSGLPRNEAYMRAHEVLQYTGLGEARYRSVEGYSTGMRQRVKLAQALIHDPPLLFLDEPTNGLDPEGREEMLTLIQDLTRNHHKDVILSTHILHDAEAVVDWVAILREGRLVGAGPIQDILPESQPLFRVRISGDPATLRKTLAHFGISGELDSRGSGLLSLPAGAGPRLLFQAASTASACIHDLRQHRPGLEEAFFHALDEKTEKTQ